MAIEDIQKQGLNIYPNPVSDYIILENLNSYDLIRISDARGQIVYEFIPESDDKIDLSFLNAGFYIINTEKEGITNAAKFIKL